MLEKVNVLHLPIVDLGVGAVVGRLVEGVVEIVVFGDFDFRGFLVVLVLGVFDFRGFLVVLVLGDFDFRDFLVVVALGVFDFRGFLVVLVFGGLDFRGFLVVLVLGVFDFRGFLVVEIVVLIFVVLFGVFFSVTQVELNPPNLDRSVIDVVTVVLLEVEFLQPTLTMRMVEKTTSRHTRLFECIFSAKNVDFYHL